MLLRRCFVTLACTRSLRRTRKWICVTIALLCNRNAVTRRGTHEPLAGFHAAPFTRSRDAEWPFGPPLHGHGPWHNLAEAAPGPRVAATRPVSSSGPSFGAAVVGVRVRVSQPVRLVAQAHPPPPHLGLPMPPGTLLSPSSQSATGSHRQAAASGLAETRSSAEGSDPVSLRLALRAQACPVRWDCNPNVWEAGGTSRWSLRAGPCSYRRGKPEYLPCMPPVGYRCDS